MNIRSSNVEKQTNFQIKAFILVALSSQIHPKAKCISKAKQTERSSHKAGTKPNDENLHR